MKWVIAGNNLNGENGAISGVMILQLPLLLRTQDNQVTTRTAIVQRAKWAVCTF